MITYVRKNPERSVPLIVRLDGIIVGEIRYHIYTGYRYYPKGSCKGGEDFESLQDCKDSIEAE